MPGDEGGFLLTIQFPPLPSSQSVGITGMRHRITD